MSFLSGLFGHPSAQAPAPVPVPVSPTVDPTALAAQAAAANTASAKAQAAGRASTMVAGNLNALQQEAQLQSRKKVGAASSAVLG